MTETLKRDENPSLGIVVGGAENEKNEKYNFVEQKAVILAKLADFIKSRGIISDEELNEFKQSLSADQRYFLEESSINNDSRLREYLLYKKNGFFEEANKEFRNELVDLISKIVKEQGVGADFLGLHHITEYIKLDEELKKRN